MQTLRIIGTRGIPAAHGGFETFAEYLSRHLVARGWRVVVYCQCDGALVQFEDTWHGVERVHIPVALGGAIGTVFFDWLTIKHAASHQDLCLTLGYNTAVFCAWLRFKDVPNLINMDGIEWSRIKWGPFAKLWLWLNEWAGCWLGNHLVADHPQIKRHLQSRVAAAKITMIPYGAEAISVGAVQPVQSLGLGLEPRGFWTVIARPEPENSLFEIVNGFSLKPRGVKLVVLGNFDVRNAYSQAVIASASKEVMFLGAIYDKKVVQSLRVHGAGYVHGHQVGGTNPSLIEALGAGSAVIAHDNRFNRWVAAGSAVFFTGADGFSNCIDEMIKNPAKLETLRQHALVRFQQEFTLAYVMGKYEALLTKFSPEK